MSAYAFWALSAVLVIASAEQDADKKAVQEKLNKSLTALPGRSGFVFTELTDQGPVLVYGHNHDERFAIGSGFKLFILGALIDEVNAERRLLENVMRLRRDLVGPPHSEMGEWPTGSPVTLHTLALKMISVSDNTATDHLLYLLGRTRVEEQLKAMGHSDPAANRPLLFTREMAMLRDKNAPGRLEQYRKLDEAGRRRFLDQDIAKLHDYERLDFDAAAFDAAEWFASPLDLARALDWIRRNTAGEKPAHSLLQVLAIDPKVKYDPKVWQYVGFKGGSEDQLLCGNWLLQHRNGKWYTFHVFCNSKTQKLDREATIKVVQELLATVQIGLR